MRKRLVRALLFVVIALGAAVGIASAAGAFDAPTPMSGNSPNAVVWE